ncbi:PAS domain-containing sensor histidine kinase [Nafulsella turpanensis]|uniref:PAS domain-containing sensor histidine kinase n=1 Tax=Nafulsella turpanensis TaxID=1265690 RepID=UPI00034940E7|nr:PAS domain-containing sensor histidine kinase [Nafulsella turpanensis]
MNTFSLREAGRSFDAWEKIIKNSLDIICTVDREGYFVNVNEASKTVIGYESGELAGKHFQHFIHPHDLEPTKAVVREVVKGLDTKNFRNRYIHRSGEEVLLLWSAVWSEEEEVLLCVGRDITEQKQVRRKLREKEELYKALIEHGSDMLALFDEELNFIFSGPSTARELGYEPEQLVGTNGLQYVHPEDVQKIESSLHQLLHSQEQVKVPEFRFKDAWGGWRWMETIGSNQLHNPAVRAIVASSRDITERVESRIELKEGHQRFQSLFEHHLDIVLFQDREGIIADVNAATLSYFKLQKETLLNQPLSNFLSAEVVNDFKQGLRHSLEGKPVHFVSFLPFREKKQDIFDIVKVPVVVNEVIVGVYCIFRNITELIHSNTTIKTQAEKLNAVLESVTDSFFTLDRNWRFTYMNSEFERLVGVERKELLGKNVWELSQEMLGREFYQEFHSATESAKAVHFETYYKRLEKWMEVKAFPSEEGLSVFINDITERMESRQELEKLSLVASRTTNGVVITNPNGFTEWVNEGFTKLTGYTFPEVEGKLLGPILMGEETDRTTSERLAERWKQNKPFSDEILNYKKSGEKVWIWLDVTPVLDDDGEVVKVVSIQTDITDRKEAEALQLQMTRDLYRQNTDLQQFTYIVSHNLRSPVANVMGLAELLTIVDKNSETFETSLGYLQKGAHQLDFVLRDLNQILTIRNKKGTTVNEKVEVRLVFQQVMATLQESLNDCQGEVNMIIDEGVGVRGNKAYLYSIFYNLLSNSLKYRSPDRKLKVTVKCVSRPESEGVFIYFSDNGIGFDMQAVGDNLFKMYKRFHHHYEGRGIGLFLVKTHVEAMDGYIEVNSQQNRGTTFLIYLKKP